MKLDEGDEAMMVLPVTLATAAAAAILNLWLGARTSARRMKAKVMMGDGGDPALQAMMRAQANYVENAPFALILVAAIELARGPDLWLWVLASAFILARVAHGLGMVRPSPNPLRGGGVMATWVVLAALAIWAVGIARHADRLPRETVIETPAAV